MIKAITALFVAIMMNQGDILPDKTFVTETTFKLFREKESTLLQK